jgi:murein DD-endopeptidase MepM/ murein hydrolase activator NlpD
MRSLALVVCALVLGGCAVTNTSYPSPTASAPISRATPPPSAYNYAAVARAPLHSELFACYRSGSNLGEIGLRGEATRYTPYMETPAGPLLRNPTEAACISSGFGWRNMSSRQHNGLDLANPSGGFIYAAGAGRIVSADFRSGFGNFVEIDHGRGVRSRYAHLAEIDPNLRPGMNIPDGVAIGRMGMTGNATGVHLHYEVMVDGLLVDPMHYGVPVHYQTTPVMQTFPEPITLPPPPEDME